MPWIIDYHTVLQRLAADGLKCQYPNGGAFGFPSNTETHVRGWIGPPDDTIKPAARPFARSVPAPYPFKLAELATLAWERCLPGNVWVMPGSHWSYELNHGSRDWMPALIEGIHLDPGLLALRADAAAIEFSPAESSEFRHFIQRLLEMLQGSDFSLAFPHRATIAAVHHHKQIWWVTTEPSVIEALDGLLPLT